MQFRSLLSFGISLLSACLLAAPMAWAEEPALPSSAVAVAMVATLDPVLHVRGSQGGPERNPTLAVLIQQSVGNAGAMGVAGLPPDPFDFVLHKPYGELPQGAAVPWIAPLERLTRTGPWQIAAVIMLMGLPELYKDGAYQPDTASLYVARLKAMKPQQVDVWCAVLTAQHGFCPATPVFLMRTSSLFDGAAPIQAELDRLLARAKSLPPAAVERWAQVAKIDATTAVFSLVRADGLFVGDAFQQARFDEAVEMAKRD